MKFSQLWKQIFIKFYLYEIYGFVLLQRENMMHTLRKSLYPPPDHFQRHPQNGQSQRRYTDVKKNVFVENFCIFALWGVDGFLDITI